MGLTISTARVEKPRKAKPKALRRPTAGGGRPGGTPLPSPSRASGSEAGLGKQRNKLLNLVLGILVLVCKTIK